MFVVVCFCGNHYYHTPSLQLVESSHNHLLLYNFTTSPLKIDEPFSTFNFAIHGLEHSETDMNS